MAAKIDQPALLAIAESIKPMDESWRASLRAKGGVLFDEIHPDPNRQALRSKLRAVGGHGALILGVEPHTKSIVEKGTVFLPKKAQLKPGDSNQCHRNAARLWFENPEKYSLATGFYMNSQGLWRQHSWCLRRNSGRIVETTVVPLVYFGCVLSEREAFRMAVSEFGESTALLSWSDRTRALLIDVLEGMVIAGHECPEGESPEDAASKNG